jgi:universal stress protein A
VTRLSPNERLVQQTQAKLRSLAKRLFPPRSRPLAVVRTGTAKTEILQAARELGADLIVIGSHATGIPETHIGSTAESLVCNARCPVLVVRRKEPLGIEPNSSTLKA